MRRLGLMALVMTLLLVGCGKSDLVAVRRPVKPIWVCLQLLKSKQECAHRFNAGLLVGAKLRAAERLAKLNGYTVRRAAPLADHEALLLNFDPRRLDVEVDAISEDATVVRFVGQG